MPVPICEISGALDTLVCLFVSLCVCLSVCLLLACLQLGMLVLHALEATVPPPARYPDLYPALFSLFGAANLLAVYIWGVVWQLSIETVALAHSKQE